MPAVHRCVTLANAFGRCIAHTFINHCLIRDAAKKFNPLTGLAPQRGFSPLNWDSPIEVPNLGMFGQDVARPRTIAVISILLTGKFFHNEEERSISELETGDFRLS